MCRQTDEERPQSDLEAIPPDDRPVVEEEDEDEYPYLGGPS
ncbi:MAG: hypothetical protein PHQ42_01120 [Patescibacteria group bacterium]|nr:hypothetical protein [Patescibacteria group bacterium]